jgi:hypothetical protein
MTEDEQDEQLRAALGKISDALGGVPMTRCIEAVATFQTFLICAVSDDEYDALVLQKELNEKTQKSISDNYDAYHAQWVDKAALQ